MTAYGSGGTSLGEVDDEADFSGLDSAQLKARKLSQKVKLEQAHELLSARESCRSDVASNLERDRQALAEAKQRKVQVQEALVRAYSSSSSCRSLQAQLTFDLVKYEAERQALADHLKQNELELSVEKSAVRAVRERLRALEHMKGALVGASAESPRKHKRLSFDCGALARIDWEEQLELQQHQQGSPTHDSPGGQETPGPKEGTLPEASGETKTDQVQAEEDRANLEELGSGEPSSDPKANGVPDTEQGRLGGESQNHDQAPEVQNEPTAGHEGRALKEDDKPVEAPQIDPNKDGGHEASQESKPLADPQNSELSAMAEPSGTSPPGEADKELGPQQDEELRRQPPESMDDQTSVSQRADSCSVASPVASTRQANSPTPMAGGLASSLSQRRSTCRSTRSTTSRPSSRADERSVESLQPTLAATLNELSIVEVEYHMRLTERSRLEQGIRELEKSNEDLEASKGRRHAQLQSLTKEIRDLRQKLADAHVCFIEDRKKMQVLKEEDEKTGKSIDYHRESLRAVAWTFDKQLSSMTPSITEARKRRHKAEGLYSQRMEQVKVLSDYTKSLVATVKQSAVAAAEAEAEALAAAEAENKSSGNGQTAQNNGNGQNSYGAECAGEGGANAAGAEDPLTTSTARSLPEGAAPAAPTPLLASSHDPVKAALEAAAIRVEWPAALQSPGSRDLGSGAGAGAGTGAGNKAGYSPTSSPNCSPARLRGPGKGSTLGSPAGSSPCSSPLPQAKRSSLTQRGRKPIILPEPPAAAPPEHAQGPGGSPTRDGSPAMVPVPPPLDLKPPNLRPTSASSIPRAGTVS